MSQVELSKANLFVLETFSPSMLQCEEAVVFIKPIDLATAKALTRDRVLKSYISRKVTATALALLLATTIGVNKSTPKLGEGEYLLFTLKTPMPGHYVIKTRQELEKYGYAFYYIRIKC